jgi:A/G-specific adenine glycosylase
MPADLTTRLLEWYDRHRRNLPWRAHMGEAVDPYRVWLSEVMLQQTTVQAVKPYFERFLTLFPRVFDLAAAPSDAVMTAWAGLGYYSRARNLHACAKAVMSEHDGRFPDTEAGLRTLPGIGPYTAAAVAAIAFNQPAAAVDGNVERVMTRLLAIETPLPAAKPLVHHETLALVPQHRPGDFAQALMDLGATICRPKQPACVLCPWTHSCRARAAGTQETYPHKMAKVATPTRRGAAFVALRSDGAVLLRTRPPKGLLGGMAETPTTAWSVRSDAQADIAHDAPLSADWRELKGLVRHVFTHFTLELTLYSAKFAMSASTPQGHRWTSLTALDDEPLSNLMRKVIETAHRELNA